MMKLWLLRPKDGSPHWDKWYDKAFGFVVRAETEQRARELAADEAGAEDWSESSSRDDEHQHNPWLISGCSTCEELSAGGSEEVVVRDFASA